MEPLVDLRDLVSSASAVVALGVSCLAFLSGIRAVASQRRQRRKRATVLAAEAWDALGGSAGSSRETLHGLHVTEQNSVLALRRAKEALEEDPSCIEALQAAAIAAAALGRRADEYLAPLARLTPKDARVWGGLAGAHIVQGDFGKARECLLRGRAIEPNSHTVLCNSARLNFELGAFAKAAEEWRSAIASDGNCLDAFANLGAVLNDKLGRCDEAADVLRGGLRRFGDEKLLLFNLAVTEGCRRRYEDALPVLRRLIELDPNNGVGQARLGACLGALDRWDEAVGPLEAAIELGDRRPEVLTSLAAALQRVGRHEESHRYIREAEENESGSMADGAVQEDPEH